MTAFPLHTLSFPPAASQTLTNTELVTPADEQCSAHLCRASGLHQTYMLDTDTPGKGLARR